jgi:uncharacterized membrane protein
VPSLNGKPGLVILCGLIFYTVVSLFIMYISNWLKFPFFTFLFVLALFFFLPHNNNHALAKYKMQRLTSRSMSGCRIVSILKNG